MGLSIRNPTISGYWIQASSLSGFGTVFVPLIDKNQSPLPVPSLSLDFLPKEPNRDKLKIFASSSAHGILCCVSITDEGYMGYDDFYEDVEDGSDTDDERDWEVKDGSKIYWTKHGLFREYYYVCKPATKEWQKIPNPKTNRLDTLQVAMVVLHSNPLHYKLIRFFKESPSSNDYDYEIFDSKRWTWEVNKLPPRPPTNSSLHAGILLHGLVHWLHQEEPIEILGLDINNGSWKIIPTPKDEELHEMYENSRKPWMKLVNCEEHIGLVCLTYAKFWMELWVLEDYDYYLKNETIRWNKSYRVDLKPWFMGYRQLTVLDVYTKDTILLLLNYEKVVWYNRSTRTVTPALDLPHRDIDARVFHVEVHPIQSDLVPCNMMC